MLTDLWDKCHSPQLWCGTSDIVQYLNRRQARGEFTLAQIRRRIQINHDLMERTRRGDGNPGEPLYTVEEIRKIFSRNKMRLATDAALYVCALACIEDSGAIGSAANLVRAATAINEPRGATVLTADMLRSMHRMVLGSNRYQLQLAQLEEYTATLRKAL
jgi:hypothetical protein